MAQSYAQTSNRISTSPKAAAAVRFFYPASTESWLRFNEVPWFTQAKRDWETRSDCVDVACIVVILMKELRGLNLFWWTPCPPNKSIAHTRRQSSTGNRQVKSECLQIHITILLFKCASQLRISFQVITGHWLH